MADWLPRSFLPARWSSQARSPACFTPPPPGHS